jgi:hypothetical protein
MCTCCGFSTHQAGTYSVCHLILIEEGRSIFLIFFLAHVNLVHKKLSNSDEECTWQESPVVAEDIVEGNKEQETTERVER